MTLSTVYYGLISLTVSYRIKVDELCEHSLKAIEFLKSFRDVAIRPSREMKQSDLRLFYILSFNTLCDMKSVGGQCLAYLGALNKLDFYRLTLVLFHKIRCGTCRPILTAFISPTFPVVF